MDVISWNLQGRRNGLLGRMDDRVALIRELDQQQPWDVLFLQEVPEDAAGDLADRLGVTSDGVHHSWPPLAEGHKDAGTVTGAAVMVRGAWTVVEAGPLPAAPSPRRTMCGLVRHEDGREVAIASAALPPAGHAEDEQPRSPEVWGAAKAAQAESLAGWIGEQRDHDRAVVVGIDANAPREDPPEWAAMKPWWDAERLLLGPDAQAKDAYRLWLKDQPDEAARIARLRPHGPLACTHLRGGVTPSRYDHLLVTDDVGVEAFRYVIGDAFAAGSDHALVQATLRIPASE